MMPVSLVHQAIRIRWMLYYPCFYVKNFTFTNQIKIPLSRNIVISVKDLKKNYDSFEAVKGISFEVYEGEIFGLLGPNGAGKTTTLEIIETLREKTSGEVTVAGLNIENNANEIKQIIGVQLQAAGYYPSLTLTELIQLFSGLYNIDVDALSMLKLVGLEDKAKAKYKELDRKSVV